MNHHHNFQFRLKTWTYFHLFIKKSEVKIDASNEIK